MTKKLEFKWVDDDQRRHVSAENLAKRLKVNVEFINVRDEHQALSVVVKGSKPDMIIMDHNLNDTTSGVFKKGSTVATYIREKWPDCPIVCITGENIEDMDYQKRAQYEDVFDISRISNYDSTILSIAKSYQKLRRGKPKTIKGILTMIGAPKRDYERLQAILPTPLKVNYQDDGLLFNLSSWIRLTLFRRPGFLYDRLWLSTFIGIKESSFEKVEKLFNKAKYKGIFADPSNDRWWKSEVLSIVADKVDEIGLPWEKGRKLPGIEKRDYSKCHASQEDFPEVVAYTDDGADAIQAPMKLERTLPHPGFENLLFFEEIRMMKPAQE